MLTGPEQPPLSRNPARQILLFLHGVGTNGHDLFGLSHLFTDIFPDAYIASPNAPFKFDMAPIPDSYQWFSLRDHSPQAMNKKVVEAAPHLSEYIDQLLEKTGLPIGKLGIIGFSQGTMTALYTMLRYTEPCGAIVGFSGALLNADTLPSEISAKPPVCLVHGEMDDVVPFDAMAAAEATLKALNVPVETHPRPGLPHSIDGEGIDICRKFLQRHLG